MLNAALHNIEKKKKWVFGLTLDCNGVFAIKAYMAAFPSKFWIYLEHCPRGEAVLIYRPSAPFLYEVASHVQ